ncbi:hypothetical protein F4806DRAFT_165513 [Annulohypoxylon nitens]|nr:hypothetical protein F4806DRAFT_165513 [Annulohypoxylon nitens]
MKVFTKALIITGLSATQVFGRTAPRGSNFEVRARNASFPAYNKRDGTQESDLFPDSKFALSGTEPLLAPAMNDTDPDFRFFDLENSIEITEMPDRSEWVIPVSHAFCSGFDLKDVNVRGSLEQIVLWGQRGNKIGTKWLHWEIDEMVGAFVCDCKWNYSDEVPASEIWEFYERLIEWCGEGRAGWIFSKKWEKGWAVATRDKIQYKSPKKLLCPWYCCFDPAIKGIVE